MITNPYQKISTQIKEAQSFTITSHCAKQMSARKIKIAVIRSILSDHEIVNHEVHYDSFGNMGVKFTLVSEKYPEIGLVVANNPDNNTIVLITVMFLTDEKRSRFSLPLKDWCTAT